ncbi:unnamed protein product [Notodromas monacha]|uniref:Uncharacterized protein n=1 Tax=Notodromas monacha TaxID=399045 RepID=A0A7R9GIJ7_9CRUS|nr:unnamed protein product [Notodromas monacha]CAG0922533.1 unnamed protein product [Notodromas monacha]
MRPGGFLVLMLILSVGNQRQAALGFLRVLPLFRHSFRFSGLQRGKERDDDLEDDDDDREMAIPLCTRFTGTTPTTAITTQKSAIKAEAQQQNVELADAPLDANLHKQLADYEDEIMAVMAALRGGKMVPGGMQNTRRMKPGGERFRVRRPHAGRKWGTEAVVNPRLGLARRPGRMKPAGIRRRHGRFNGPAPGVARSEDDLPSAGFGPRAGVGRLMMQHRRGFPRAFPAHGPGVIGGRPGPAGPLQMPVIMDDPVVWYACRVIDNETIFTNEENTRFPDGSEFILDLHRNLLCFGTMCWLSVDPDQQRNNFDDRRSVFFSSESSSRSLVSLVLANAAAVEETTILSWTASHMKSSPWILLYELRFADCVLNVRRNALNLAFVQVDGISSDVLNDFNASRVGHLFIVQKNDGSGEVPPIDLRISLAHQDVGFSGGIPSSALDLLAYTCPYWFRSRSFGISAAALPL